MDAIGIATAMVEFEGRVLEAVSDWTDEEVELAFGFSRPSLTA